MLGIMAGNEELFSVSYGAKYLIVLLMKGERDVTHNIQKG